MSEHFEADLLDEYALGTLDATASARVAAHLKECGACRAELAALRAVLDVLPHALDEKPADAALLERIVAQTRTAPIAPKLLPSSEVAWFSSPLVRALAAGLILALASDAWLAVREFQKTPQTVAVATPAAATPIPATPAPAATAAHATATTATGTPATPAATSASATAAPQDPALRRKIARLERDLAAEKAHASANDARSRADIQRLEQTLASTRTAVRIVYVKPPPLPVPSPPATAAATAAASASAAAPELVAALRTGRVFAVDGTVGKEPWHLTIVQPADGAKAEIFSGTPHAPEGQTYRTWVVRAGKTYDAGPLPPGEPTTLVMPMALQSGDVVAFSREPVGTGDHPTQPFLMKVTIAE